MRLSVLDLSPVSAGSTSTEALRNTLDLARLADDLGYHRYWLAEHHNTTAIASSVPEVMIGHVADVTTRIRVGSGGVMLPNHAPLKVAETFRLLEALHPDRVDLGIGRAPGTDPLTAFALRRSREGSKAEDFPQQMEELLAFFSGKFPPDHPFRDIRAMPEGVPAPEIWLLGSSDYSAILAAELGLGFAFAHHINPAPAIESLGMYHQRFKPSAYFSTPRSMIAVSVVCAETDALAETLSWPIKLAMLRFRTTGRLGPLPTVDEAANYPYTVAENELIRVHTQRLFVGSPAKVRQRLLELAEKAGVQEIMIMTTMYEHQHRRRSYELLAEAFGIMY